ncbi:MAG: transposase [Thermomicrobiales bacterium]|nr:transposase [Thermomicrobiales bacterium]
MPDRACLAGILFVPGPGAQWALLPQGTGCGAGMTCWRRLRDWQHARVWDALHQAFLDRPGEAGQSDWRRACIDPAWLNRF